MHYVPIVLQVQNLYLWGNIREEFLAFCDLEFLKFINMSREYEFFLLFSCVCIGMFYTFRVLVFLMSILCPTGEFQVQCALGKSVIFKLGSR
jgi:hypothetical protein